MSKTREGWSTPAPVPGGQAPAPPEAIGAYHPPIPPGDLPAPPGATYVPLGGRARWASALIKLSVAVQALTLAAVATWLLVPQGGVNEAALDALGLVELALLLPTAAVFIAWLARAYANLDTLGVARRHRVGWAVGSWFVPFLNLVRPKQITDEVWTGSTGHERTAVVTWWWALWILSGLATRAAYTHGVWPGAARGALLLACVGLACVIAAGVLILRIIRQVTDQQQHLNAKVGTQSPGAVPAPAGWVTDGSPPASSAAAHSAGPRRGVRAAVGGAALAGLVVLAAIGWGIGTVLEELTVGDPTPLSEEQLASLVVTADDLGDGWWELPPASPEAHAAEQALLSELLGDEDCGAYLHGRGFASNDETTFVSSLAGESCAAPSEQVGYARRQEEQFVAFHEHGLRRYAAAMEAELSEVDGREIDHGLGDDVYALEVTGTFRLDGESFALHVVDVAIYADHGYVSVVFEQWHRPVPQRLQRDTVEVLREKLDALGTELVAGG